MTKRGEHLGDVTHSMVAASSPLPASCRIRYFILSTLRSTAPRFICMKSDKK